MKRKSIIKRGLLTTSLFIVTLMIPVVINAQVVIAQPVNVIPQGGGACSNLGSTGLNGVVSCLVGIMGNIIVLLMAAAVLFVVYGAFEMIYSEEKREAGKQRIYYGIIGLFVMVSIWGLVAILDSSFNLSGGTPIPAPKLR